ncbi:MAG TPA: hypothetical protein VN905_13000 [Candidatus Binatia bacterium]|nr:hypothetical protein [Candidatus Binatia bacterium]
MSYEEIAIYSRIIGTLVVFGMLWYLFARFAAPVITRAQELKNEEIARAERRRTAERTRLDTMIAELTEATRAADAIRRTAEDVARRERERAVAQTREAGERALRNADGELDRARATARDALRIELIEKALQRASREASAHVDAKRNAALIDEFLGKLERRAPGA